MVSDMVAVENWNVIRCSLSASGYASAHVPHVPRGNAKVGAQGDVAHRSALGVHARGSVHTF